MAMLGVWGECGVRMAAWVSSVVVFLRPYDISSGSQATAGKRRLSGDCMPVENFESNRSEFRLAT